MEIPSIEEYSWAFLVTSYNLMFSINRAIHSYFSFIDSTLSKRSGKKMVDFGRTLK